MKNTVNNRTVRYQKFLMLAVWENVYLNHTIVKYACNSTGESVAEAMPYRQGH